MWNSFLNIINKVWDFIKKHPYVLLVTCILILSLCLYNQCNRNSELNQEVQRLENNILAVSDTLTQYIDENGRIIAEKHAYQLTEKELRDSIELLKTKNREYLAYINANIGIRDTIVIPTYIERPFEIDTVYYTDQGIIRFDKFDAFGKSNREVHVSIPYNISDKLVTGNANLDMYHNIFVESMLERDVKTGETFVRLISDYPDLKFNDGMGVVVTNSKTYDKSVRKTKGIGLAVGPSVGLNYDFINKKIIPTVGVNVTIGFTWTPKFTQW